METQSMVLEPGCPLCCLGVTVKAAAFLWVMLLFPPAIS